MICVCLCLEMGNTMAHLCCQAGQAECLNCCIQHDISLESVNHFDETPLDLARKSGKSILIHNARMMRKKIYKLIKIYLNNTALIILLFNYLFVFVFKLRIKFDARIACDRLDE